MTLPIPILTDPVFTRMVECARLEARVQGVCVECGRPTDRYELDASSRCNECRP
jgi:hypothetical protein